MAASQEAVTMHVCHCVTACVTSWGWEGTPIRERRERTGAPGKFKSGLPHLWEQSFSFVFKGVLFCA